MQTDLESLELEELKLLARQRGVVMPIRVTREALVPILRELPEPITSNSKYEGMRIVRAKEYQNGGNPRRAGGHGYNAYELIPLGDFGIRFEDLMARIKQLPAKSSRSYGAGGTNHIKWDLDRGFTYLVPDKRLERPVGTAPATPPPAEAEAALRPRDSSKTRVVPVLDAVSATGAGWVRKLLALPVAGASAAVVDPPPRLEPEAAFWGDNERALDPPVALLSWLIRNLPVAPVAGETSETAERRRRLYDRDPQTIRAALQALRSSPSPKAWHVLEGQSYPDAVIETPDAVIVIEGKRTEPGPTTSTTYMPVRHQMLRHIDGAWEIRGRRRVFGFFIVEGENGSERVPEKWIEAARATIDPATVAASLPHRSAEERGQIVAAFLGVTTWGSVCAAFHMDPRQLPDTVN